MICNIYIYNIYIYIYIYIYYIDVHASIYIHKNSGKKDRIMLFLIFQLIAF